VSKLLEKCSICRCIDKGIVEGCLEAFETWTKKEAAQQFSMFTYCTQLYA
jgi:hypothetical protein